MKIIADSGCDFTVDMLKNRHINVERVALNLQILDKQYIDDGSIDIEEFLGEMQRTNSVAKSAAPSPQAFLDKFQGEESVFAVTLSSHLSSSYNNAMLAKSILAEARPDKFVHVFDSLSASIGETLIVLKINEFIRNNLAESVIVEKTNAFIHSMKIYFVLEKYDNIVKNGRLSPSIAKLASALSIKLICGGVEGKIELLEKARGTRKALAKLADMIAGEKIDFENRTLGISHVKCLEKALLLKDEILKRVAFKNCIIVDAGGLITTYADKEGLVISF